MAGNLECGVTEEAVYPEYPGTPGRGAQADFMDVESDFHQQVPKIVGAPCVDVILYISRLPASVALLPPIVEGGDHHKLPPGDEHPFDFTQRLIWVRDMFQ